MNNQLTSPQSGGMIQPSFLNQTGGALSTVMSNAKTTEALASIFIAKQFPRDLASATRDITLACSRPRLAEVATYAYPRGGQTVEGPSIRLAEVLLSAWGNAEAGWEEIAQRFDSNGAGGKGCNVSTCKAFCFDKEKNIKREIAFDVPHVRYTRNGVTVLNDPRDIYELCANMASRRIRACILQIIPSYIVDEALEVINKTLSHQGGKKNLPDLIRKMKATFLEIGVTDEQLSAYLGVPVDQAVMTDVQKLGKVYNSIKDGYTRAADVFPVEVKATVELTQSPTPEPTPTPEPAAPSAELFDMDDMEASTQEYNYEH